MKKKQEEDVQEEVEEMNYKRTENGIRVNKTFTENFIKLLAQTLQNSQNYKNIYTKSFSYS